MMLLEAWLIELGMEKYLPVLVQNDIDLQVLPTLSDADFEKLGLSLGHRRKIMAASARIGDALAPVVASLDNIRDTLPQVERRQVTVLFADLVGSTAISGVLDPEDMSTLLRNFQERCAKIIESHDGYVAKYMGDGILAYFGFPVAYENAAEYAIRAGLEIAREVAKMQRPDQEFLAARVGIATGLVVVGEIIGAGASQERNIVGNTPNLAARLQALAEPGWVLVSSSTERLAGRFFDYAYLGEHSLKGFAQSIPVWRMLAEKTVQSRFAAIQTGLTGPLVGRGPELGYVMEFWASACNREGHAILLCGEAGMGKSRLLEAIAQSVMMKPHRLLRCQCSPYHRNSALYPILQLLRQVAEIRAENGDTENLHALEFFLKKQKLESRYASLLLAEALDISTPEQISPMEMTKAQRKTETLTLLRNFLFGTAGDEPTLLLLEDAHWIDPTSQDLIDSLIRTIEQHRLLTVITQRPDVKLPWAELPQATMIACKKLNRDQSMVIIRHLMQQKLIAENVIEEIVNRSDGVPLFVEELTKAVLEDSVTRPANVPASLQDSLMARLDRLGRAKDIAQVASVIGRVFEFSLLAELIEITHAELSGALGHLLESGLVFRRGAQGEERYNFNHSLVQEAAYESLLKSRRQILHQKTALILQRRLEESRGGEPELIAHHFSHAGQHAEACRYWHAAADLASSRSAYVESVASLNRALEDAAQIADAEAQVQMRLETYLMLGTNYLIQQGPMSSSAGTALTEARTLALGTCFDEQLYQATWGLYLNAATNRHFDLARQRVNELFSIGEKLNDEDTAVESLHHRWGFSFFTGQTRDALNYALEGAKRYTRERHHRNAHVSAFHDVGLCARCNVGIAHGILGNLPEAKLHLLEAARIAESLGHPNSIQFGLGNASFGMYISGFYAECEDYAQRQLAIAKRYDFPMAVATANFFMAAAEVRNDPGGIAIKVMEDNLEATIKAGFFVMTPGSILAEALDKAGRTREALRLLDRLLEATRDPEVGSFMSELWRLRGEFTLCESRENKSLGESYLRTAVRIATAQEAGQMRLRAALPLARLLGDDGRRKEAHDLLAAALDENSLAVDCSERAKSTLLLAELA